MNLKLPDPTGEIKIPESWRWYASYFGRRGATDPDTGAKMTGDFSREFFGSKSLAAKRYRRLRKSSLTTEATLYSVSPAEGGLAGSKLIEGYVA